MVADAVERRRRGCSFDEVRRGATAGAWRAERIRDDAEGASVDTMGKLAPSGLAESAAVMADLMWSAVNY